MVRYRNPAENRISITYDDKRIDEERIVHELLKGGMAIVGKKPPATPPPLTYK